MKIALCYSGHMRTFDKAFYSQNEKFLTKYNPDIFIHTWESGFNYNDVIRLYNPISLCVEKEKQLSDPFQTVQNHKGMTSHSVISMFYKIWACNELKKQHEKSTNTIYDLVVRIRPDSVYLNEIAQDELNKTSKYIFISAQSDPADIWIDDTFAFSSSKNMDCYSSTYLYLDEIYGLIKGVHPEIMLNRCLNKFNIQYKLSNIKCGILRENGEVFGHNYLFWENKQ